MIRFSKAIRGALTAATFAAFCSSSSAALAADRSGESDIADFVLMVSVASRHLNDTEAEEFDADLRRMRTDSLGHDIVVY